MRRSYPLKQLTDAADPSRATVTNWLEEDNRGGHAPLRDNVTKIVTDCWSALETLSCGQPTEHSDNAILECAVRVKS